MPEYLWRGADRLPAYYRGREIEMLGPQVPRKREGMVEVEAGPGWTQAGCLAALGLTFLFILGLCWLGKELLEIGK